MNFSDPKSQWIFAVKDGSPLNSSDKTAILQQHTINDVFTFDLTKAAGGNSLNPFTQSTAVASTSAGDSAPTSTSSSNSTAADNGPPHGSNWAHGIIMSLTFLYDAFLICHYRRTDSSRIFFPLGALTVRLLSFQGLVWIHAGSQVFAYSLALVGCGLGIWVAVVTAQVRSPLAVLFP